MATETQTDFNVTGEWRDLIADRPELAGQNLSLQLQTNDIVNVVAGGDQAPDGSKSGWRLTWNDEAQIQAATSVWIKAGGDRSATMSVNIR